MPDPKEEEGGGRGLLEYWHLVRRHRGTLVLAVCLGGLIGFLLTLPAARLYQARLTLELQGLNDEFLGMRNVNPTVEASGGVGVDIQTQVRLLQSTGLLARARQQLEAAARPTDLRPADRLGLWRAALQLHPPAPEALWQQAIDTAVRHVTVRSSPTNRILEVACESTSPQVAAAFCNTLAHEYVEQNLEARWATSEYTGEWLTKQLQDLKGKLEAAEGRLQAYAQSAGLLFTGESTNIDETKLTDLQKELSAAQADRIAKQSQYEMAVASPPGALPDVLDDEQLKEQQAALAELSAKLAQLRVAFTDQHAEVRKVQAQIVSLEASLEASRGNILNRIRNEYQAAQRRETLLASTYTAQARQVSGRAEEAAHYHLLKREVDASRLLYDTLTQKMKEASIASALRANNIRVVDAATPPTSPAKPNVPQRTALGLLAGLLLGLGFIVVREQADRTLQDPGDVTYYLGVPELGIIPVGELLSASGPKKGSRFSALQRRKTDASDRVETIAWRQKSSLVAESFRTVLTSILFSHPGDQRPRVIVFTSAAPKEGKTTTVCNLGIALAEINNRVLLIDGDLRRPRLHDVFGVSNEQGLSNLLLAKTLLDAPALEAACAPTLVPGLCVLPSGAARHNASSLLHSSRLPELLAIARERFDTVIVDTPPMVNIADARVFARTSDAVILVVRSGVTTRDAALLAKSRFADDGIPLLGTILNFWNPKAQGYGNYSWYYDGYQHYYGSGSGGGEQGGGGEVNSAHSPRGERKKRRGFAPLPDAASREMQS